MQKVPYTNPHRHAVHIGSTLVASGETRMVDPRLVPAEKPAAVGKPAEVDPPAPVARKRKSKG